MQLRLTKPELAKFVEDKVRSGDFPSADVLVEGALARMMDDEVSLSAEDVGAIAEADAEIDRGESVEFDVFAAEMRRKFGGGK